MTIVGWCRCSSAPALAFILVGSLLPIAATAWEALHGHDLRLPWLGRPFIGLDNFIEAAGDPRFRAAFVHTVAFAAITVPVELGLGLGLALIMQTATRGRSAVRLAALLPWAVPTVVAALVVRFMFDGQTGVVTAMFRSLGLIGPAFDWLVHPLAPGCQSASRTSGRRRRLWPSCCWPDSRRSTRRFTKPPALTERVPDGGS